MNSQYSKITRVTDQSFNSKSNQLYNPLRNALIKSQFPADRPYHYSQVAKDNFKSALSNKRSNLSPNTARNIRQTTFLPIQSQLVATNKLYKVSGKGYTIIDVQEQIKNPLTGSQFAKIPNPNFQQIVYQIKENGDSRISKASENRKKKLKVSAQFSKQQEETTNAYVTKQSTREFQNNYLKPFSVVHPNNQQHLGTLYSEEYSSLALSQGIQPYKFKKDLLSEGSSINSKLKKKKDYKYNLFSILDEIGNNGCGVGFTENEFCAPRRANTQWS